MRCATAEDSRAAGVTYHLVPADIWAARGDAESYTPDGFEAEGFIHCTNGLGDLLATGNRYYQHDTRPYLALALDIRRVSSPVRYDDPDERYPHIHGPLNTSAIVATYAIERAPDGRFTGLHDVA